MKGRSWAAPGTTVAAMKQAMMRTRRTATSTLFETGERAWNNAQCRPLFRRRQLARESLGSHDRCMELDFVCIRPAEVDVPGQREPQRARQLRILDLLKIVRSEVRRTGEQIAEVRRRSIVLIQR